jgi:hypothetical protein
LEVLQQTALPDLIAGRGTGNSRSGEQGVLWRSGLPELIAESARSAAGSRGIAGDGEKKSWSFWWLSSTVFAPGAEEAAMFSNGTERGMARQRAGAAVGDKDVDIWAIGIEGQALASIAQR